MTNPNSPYVTPEVFPVRGPVNYVPATYYQLRGGGTRRHEGHDIVAPAGTPVISATPGVVRRVYRNAQVEGNGVLIVDAQGAMHGYFHFESAPLVYEGQEVAAGTLLGYVGSTGRANGPHLHYQIERGGRRYNASEKLLDLLETDRLAGRIPPTRYMPWQRG